MRTRTENATGLLAGSLLVLALAATSQAGGLGDRLKSAQAKMNNARDKADRVLDRAQEGIAKAEEGVTKAQAGVDKVQTAVDRIENTANATARYGADVKQAAAEVKRQYGAVASDPAAASDLLDALEALASAAEQTPNLPALPPGAPARVPSAATEPVPAAVDELFEARPAADVQLVKRGTLRGLPVVLASYAFESQTFQAAVNIPAAARGLLTVPALLDDAAFSAWLASGAAPAPVFTFTVACPPEQLAPLSAAAQSGSLVAEIACDVLAVTGPGAGKTYVVRPTQVDVRLLAAVAPPPGMAGGN